MLKSAGFDKIHVSREEMGTNNGAWHAEHSAWYHFCDVISDTVFHRINAPGMEAAKQILILVLFQ